MKQIALLILVVLSFSLAIDTTMTLTGQGSVKYRPNMAIIQLGIEDIFSDAGAGQKEINKKMNEFIKSAMGYLPKEQMETNAIQVYRKYDYRDGRTVFTGYEIKQSLRIYCTHLELVGTLVDLSMKSGLNSLYGITFSHTQPDAFQKDALQMALKDATQKAKLIAQNLGLSDVQLMDLQVNGIPESVFGAAQPRLMSIQSADTATTTLPGELTATQIITAKYSFKGKPIK
jgi:uncharacterized protein YggE